MSKSEVEIVHRAIWKMQECLAKDKQELETLEAERTKHLANEALDDEEKVDSGSPALLVKQWSNRKLEALRTHIQEEENALTELCARHREALKEEEKLLAERGRTDYAAVAAKQAEAERAYSAALGQTMLRQAELEAVNLELQAAMRYSISPPQSPSVCSIGGTIEEILRTAKTDPSLAVDPRSLTETLTRMEEQQRGMGFPGGNKVLKQDGKVYIPSVERIHVDFDPRDGQVIKSKILSVAPVEARPQDGVLVPVEGAVPIKFEEPTQVAPGLLISRPTSGGFSVPAGSDPLNVKR